ncbi:hypothetical protein OS493_036510 [Desmophyllum pertusum]|uniref:Uncharacterized protein n=1 Tax=Desmophyllum pertusum TaxID=174260 RepID=A0A9W9ZVK4_9CNID|nr:hypothetical protein OS493_036510 [Desmophyllum pertusum]
MADENPQANPAEEADTEHKETEAEEETQVRSQMLCELQRVEKDMINNSSIVSKPEVKPYTPDIFNDLSPYYNRYIVKYMINDQVDYVPRPGWGTRATTLRLVDPEESWRMDHFPGPKYDTVIPRCFYKPQIWSKNVSGKDDNQGSTRLPPIPKPFRSDINRLKETKAQRRMKEDRQRTLNDWQRMNLTELKVLPDQSRYHVKKAIMSYLGTSKGSNKALKPLLSELSTAE